MNVASVLLDILIVLLAAKVAAEASERVRLPAVVGEILAGILIGPSALGLVKGDDILRVLGELGVILLLLDVGLEMDLKELGAVGRASMAVATVGVVVPFAGGFAFGLVVGMTTKEALFVGAALTATSVGITARVFGDLRALTSVEARTVLGAAVADDVMGLVILTVVVRVVEQGQVSVVTVLEVVGVAVAFLVFATVISVRLIPIVFSQLARFSRSPGTLVAVALAYTLGVAELANAARLAPIVGAFVAGIALGRADTSERVKRELTPVGHLLIPVFFLQIGIDARIGDFARGHVLVIATGLLAVAIVGKLASVVGLIGAPGDRLLIGIGMVPRGEVGLIFATIGLQQHVFGSDVYAALLLVVLVSTILPPPLLRWRLLRVRGRTTPARAVESRPATGWLERRPTAGDNVMDLAAQPPSTELLHIALAAAGHAREARPGPRLLEWLGSAEDVSVRWDSASKTQLFDLLRNGGPRAWRFLALTGMLERALPELAKALAGRPQDPFDPDPLRRWQLQRLFALQGDQRTAQLERPDRLLLAAFLVDLAGGGPEVVALARRVVQRLDLGAGAEEDVAALIGDVDLLRGAARRLDAFGEEQVLMLAVHLRSLERARALGLLTTADEAFEPIEAKRLAELVDLVEQALAHPELTSREARNLVQERRERAKRLVNDPMTRERIDAAPRAYVVAVQPGELARQATLCEPPIGREVVRCQVTAETDGWRVDFAARDRVGLLARETAVLADAGPIVRSATVVTWADGTALASFGVDQRPEADHLRAALLEVLDAPLISPPTPDIEMEFDDTASPWHTVCRVGGQDRPGLLFAVTTAFAAARVSVHSARIETAGGRLVDLFMLSGSDGATLNQQEVSAIRRGLSEGVAPPRSIFRRRRPAHGYRPDEPYGGLFTGTKQTADSSEIQHK